MKEQKTRIFDGINEKCIENFIKCSKAKVERYKKGDIILDFTSSKSTFGIIKNGLAHIEQISVSGNRSILEQLESGDMFCNHLSGSFFMPSAINVVAKKDCDVLIMNMENITKMCSNACEYHSKILENIINIMSQKIIAVNRKLEIISARSIREKLMNYFTYIIYNGNGKSGNIPFNLTMLADYLCIDRSAMMREIKKLKEDKIISLEGKKITLLKNPSAE